MSALKFPSVSQKAVLARVPQGQRLPALCARSLLASMDPESRGKGPRGVRKGRKGVTPA